jgi:hypothetical protein
MNGPVQYNIDGARETLVMEECRGTGTNLIAFVYLGTKPPEPPTIIFRTQCIQNYLLLLFLYLHIRV